MTTRTRALLLIAVIASPCHLLAQASGIGLQAKAVASGGRVRSGSGVTPLVQDYAFDGSILTPDFWRARERESQVGLEIDVRNFRRSPQAVEVLALFMAKDIQAREFFMLSAEQAIFTLFNGEFTRVRMYSGVARNSTGRTFIRGIDPDPYGYYPFLWSATNLTEGTKIGGWIVVAMVNGRVLEVRTSGPTMDNLARDENALSQMIRPLMAAQKPKPPR